MNVTAKLQAKHQAPVDVKYVTGSDSDAAVIAAVANLLEQRHDFAANPRPYDPTTLSITITF